MHRLGAESVSRRVLVLELWAVAPAGWENAASPGSAEIRSPGSGGRSAFRLILNSIRLVLRPVSREVLLPARPPTGRRWILRSENF